MLCGTTLPVQMANISFILCEVGPLTQCLHKFKHDLMQGEVTCSCVFRVACQKQSQLMTICFWFELQITFFFLFGNTWLIQMTTCLYESSVPKMIVQVVWSEGSVSFVGLEDELELPAMYYLIWKLFCPLKWNCNNWNLPTARKRLNLNFDATKKKRYCHNFAAFLQTL